MLIQGTIQAVSPPDFQDKHNNHYQNITIQTVQGPVTGRIGTKNPYTNQNIGQQGQWDCEQAQGGQGPYNKLKKHYDRPYQGQQAPQQAAQATNAPQNREMHIMRLAVLKAVLSATDIPLDMVNDYLLASMQFAFTGKWSVRLPTTPNPAMGGEEFPEEFPPPNNDIPDFLQE